VSPGRLFGQVTPPPPPFSLPTVIRMREEKEDDTDNHAVRISEEGGWEAHSFFSLYTSSYCSFDFFFYCSGIEFYPPPIHGSGFLSLYTQITFLFLSVVTVYFGFSTLISQREQSLCFRKVNFSPVSRPDKPFFSPPPQPLGDDKLLPLVSFPPIPPPIILG